MEPSNNSVTIETEAITTSPQSSVSQEDWGSGLWMEGSDSEDRDSGRDNSPPMTREATRSEQEDTWPDINQSDWSMVEPCQVISAETSDGSDSEIEAFHFPEICASPTWPAEGDNERNSRQGTEGAASTTTTSQPSLLQQEQDGFLQHGTTADSQQGELLLQRLCLIQQKQEVQQVFEGSPPLATVAPEPASQRPGCHGSACVVVSEWAGRRREGEEKASEPTGGEAQQSVAGLHTGEEGSEEQRERGAESAQKGETKANGGREGQSNPPVHGRGNRMEALNGEDNQSDSGVSADFSPNSTMELCSAPYAPEDPDADPAPLNETPIEREIRRAVEREQSLRRARGLTRTQEFVEIPLRKPVLSQTAPSRSGKGEGTDRQFAGKKMLKEIGVEARREEVLVQMGKLPGVYDKGTASQLLEKKQLFEAFQEKRETFGGPTPQSKRPSSSASDVSASGSRTGDGLNAGPASEGGRSLDRTTQKQDQKPGSAGHGDKDFSNTHQSPCGPTLSEGTSSPVIILESNVFLHTPVPNMDGLQHPSRGAGSLPEAHDVTVVDSGTVGEGQRVVGEAEGREETEEEEEEEEVSMVRENPFFKLRSSMSLRPDVEQDIQEGKQRERELRRQRSSLYGTSGAGGGRPASTGTRSPTPSQNGLSTSELPSYTASPTTSARQSLGKLDLTWPPTQPSAEVTGQTEAPRSRRKTQLLQRWESGVVNGHEEEQD